jgi:Tfp pilus assembly protein PilO
MKKNKRAVQVLLVLLCLSAAGCLFSFVYGQYKDLSRQNRLKIFRNFERQEKEAQALEKEYQDWQKLPEVLQKFRRGHILSIDEFAAFRRFLDSSLAANQLHPLRIDFTFDKSMDNIRTASVRLSLDGSYRNLKKFIFDMESESKMYFLESMDLIGDGVTVKGSFTLEVYLDE